jgi:Flp pilus assembly protein TadD
MKFIININFFLFLIFLATVFPQKRSTKLLKRQGIMHMETGKYAEAIDVFNKYIAINPREPEGYYFRALSYEKRQIYQNAVLDLRRAIALTPNNSIYRENLNKVFSIWYPILRKKIEGHKREIAIDKKSALDYLEIGKSYRWLEEWYDAELWYDRYLALDEDASADEIIRYSNILGKTGHIKKGEKILKIWVEKYPNDWRLWSRYGYFSLWLGYRSTAENAFRNALDIKPFFKEAQDGLDNATDKAYVIVNQPRAYERRYIGYPIDLAYNKLKSNPSDANTRFKLVELLIYGKRFAEARQQLNILSKKYIESEPFKELDVRLKNIIFVKYSSLLAENLPKLKQFPENKSVVKDVANSYSKLQKYEEANEIMVEYLDLHPNDYEIKEYYAEILAVSGDYYGGAEVLSELIDSGYTSDRIVEKTANYFGNDFDYDNSIRVIEEHIDGKPIEESKEFKFQLAQYFAWNYQWDDARDQVEELREVFPKNKKYKLLEAQLIVWTVDDTEFETAEVNLKEILEVEPNNLEAILGLATIHSWKREFPEAKELLDKAKLISPDNSEVVSVENFYNVQFSLEDDRRKNEVRSEVGMLINDNQLDAALEKYEEYFEMKGTTPRDAFMEYASIHMALENYDSSIEIYDHLLDQEYDFNAAIAKANAYLWKGDSLNALNQFLELVDRNPDNYNAKIGLATAYIVNQEYRDADEIYDSLLAETEDSVQINSLLQKKELLPLYGVNAAINSAYHFILPYNLTLSPSFSFYDDNQELTYYQSRFNADVGIFRYFTIGGSWSRTAIYSSTINQRLEELSGQIYFYPFEKFSIGGSIGKLDIEKEKFKNIGNIEARWFSDDLLLSAGYRDTDARLLLYSPNLIYNSLDAYIYHFSGNYRLNNDYKFLLYYQYFNISDGNIANDIRFRFGKFFNEEFFFGYEYFFADYGFSTINYYSPQEYSSHSIWADYEYKEFQNFDLSIGGKVGYAPSIDFIIGDIYAEASYEVLETLRLSGKASYGHSFRFDGTYQFISIYASAYWSLW